MTIGILFGAFKRYVHYRRLATCIEKLDDRMLFDIGCSRSELYAEAWARAGRRAAH
jgi:uncharacterized protein YjiS (DUF1127 family)